MNWSVYLSLLSRIFAGKALKGISSSLWHLWTIFTYTSPEVEKRSSSGEGREAEEAITEVFAVWDRLEIQYDSHQSEIFLDATEKDRLCKEKFYFQINKYEGDKLKGKLLDNFFRVLLPSIVFPLRSKGTALSCSSDRALLQRYSNTNAAVRCQVQFPHVPPPS